MRSQPQTKAIEILAMALGHGLTWNALPSHHKDPFDILRSAQAMVQSASLVTGALALAGYPVPVIRPGQARQAAAISSPNDDPGSMPQTSRNTAVMPWRVRRACNSSDCGSLG